MFQIPGVHQGVSVREGTRFLVVSMAFGPSLFFCLAWPVLSIYIIHLCMGRYGNSEQVEDEVSEV